jgi:serpin B
MSDPPEKQGAEAAGEADDVLRVDAEAVRRYAASLPDLEWQAPAEIRLRGNRRRRLRRVAEGSVVAVSVAVCIVISLTLSSSSSRTPSHEQATGTTTTPSSHGVIEVASDLHRARAMSVSAPSPLTLAEQGFALRLTDRLLAAAGGANVLVSPASLDAALNMLELGATGATGAGIADTLGESQLPAVAASVGWNGLEQQLQATSGPLRLSSNVFVQRGSHVSTAYLGNLTRYYGAGVEEVDFAATTAAGDVNAWLRAQASAQVPFTSGSVSSSTKLLLTEGSSFSAKWGSSVQFSGPSSEKRLKFHLTAASEVTATMMQLSSDSVKFVSTPELHAVVLPYAGQQFEAVVLQPGDRSTAALLSSLTPAGLSALVGSAHLGALTVWLPKFSVSATTSLRPALEALGMGAAFASGADFTNLMRVPGARLQDVLQAGSLSVNETGTNATQSALSELTTVHGQPEVIRFNHPFLFVIRDIATGAIVSDAVINDPNQAGS